VARLKTNRRRVRSMRATSAGGIVLRSNQGGLEIVLGKRLRERDGATWTLPKGTPAGAESTEETALREVREETGIERLELRGPLPTIDWFFREGPDLIHKYCHFFLMETRDAATAPQLDEGITECIWLPLDRALETLTYDNARAVLEAAGRLTAEAEAS
jgi:ADP-ribose pyrophosphatase YjhB (NUDIX family)